MVVRLTMMNQLKWVPYPEPRTGCLQRKEVEAFFGGVPGGGMADCILSLPAKKIGKSENEK